MTSIPFYRAPFYCSHHKTDKTKDGNASLRWPYAEQLQCNGLRKPWGLRVYKKNGMNINWKPFSSTATILNKRILDSYFWITPSCRKEYTCSAVSNKFIPLDKKKTHYIIKRHDEAMIYIFPFSVWKHFGNATIYHVEDTLSQSSVKLNTLFNRNFKHASMKTVKRNSTRILISTFRLDHTDLFLRSHNNQRKNCN